MDWRDLEDEFVEAIQRCVKNNDDKEKAKAYFVQTTVVELIDQAFRE